MSAVISIATADDAGFWADALRFVHFKVCDHAPCDDAEGLGVPHVAEIQNG